MRMVRLDFRGADTIVGTDMWIGIDCLILPGIQVEDGAIIAI
jgi:virginiamycin A acetyltransferase